MSVPPVRVVPSHFAALLLAAAGLWGCAAWERGETYRVAAHRPALPMAPAVLPEDVSAEEVPWLRPLPASIMAAVHAPGCTDCAELLNALGGGKRPRTPAIPGEAFR